MNLSPAEVDALLAKLSPTEKLEFLEELEEQARRVRLKKAQTSMTKGRIFVQMIERFESGGEISTQFSFGASKVAESTPAWVSFS